MNKKLNIILICVSIILLFMIRYTINYAVTVNNSRELFKVSEIKNIDFKDESSSFKTDGKTFTFIVNGNTIYYNENFNLNTKTGEMIENTLYLRNVTDKYIIIWYNEIEYKLYR